MATTKSQEAGGATTTTRTTTTTTTETTSPAKPLSLPKVGWETETKSMQRYLWSVLRSLSKSPAGTRSLAIFLLLFFLLLLLTVTAFLPTRLPLYNSSAVSGTAAMSAAKPEVNIATKPGRRELEIPLNCTAYNVTRSCTSNYPASYDPDGRFPDATCPGYFRWIHEDLRPWSRTGITRDVLERARATANFRLTIIDGRAYVETYKKSFQTRDLFTLWGILQLLRRYPGRVPDLELMFDCVDWPVVQSRIYKRPNATSPPPLFRYCGDDATLDIVFPDWSFWGWPEVNIKPWESLLKELKEGNEKIKWMDREPYAYWKGNPAVAATRQDLMKCNVSDQRDWNARVYRQDWIRESQEGYKQSDLASQCIHRYKIYIEGSAWSVSEKYILACNSVTLLVKPRYYDFFTRGLMPVHHYWPVKDNDKCKSIKFAVDWGNRHKQKAQAIGNAASDFIQDELRMDMVYDYMFHLLNEYAKLLRFKPEVSKNAIELCPETMACETKELEKKFMEESLVKRPADSYPCELPPPFDDASLYAHRRRKVNSIGQVEMWEDRFWEAHKL